VLAADWQILIIGNVLAADWQILIIGNELHKELFHHLGFPFYNIL